MNSPTARDLDTPRWKAWRTWLIFFTLWALLGGCTGGGTFRGKESVGEIHMFGVPQALDLDRIPGTDGIGLRIYASPPGLARGIPIVQGALDVMMFEGVLDEKQVRTVAPLKFWHFEASKLRSFTAETSLGTGYQLALQWEANRPRGNAVTVWVRYQSPSGTQVYSNVNAISVPAR